MGWARVAAVVGLALLAGCGQQGGPVQESADLAAPGPDAAVKLGPGAAAGEAGGPSGQPAAGAAFIAYSYRWGFELPSAAVLPTLAAHRALCADMGPARCQLLGSSQTRGEGDAIEATLELKVAPGDTAGFGQQLEASVAAADGRTLSSEVAGEDLTRQLIDAEAALRAKRTLRDRLQQLLEDRDGKLADLLETEKALAQTQAELDGATALLAELRRRVDLSAVTISYRSTRSLTFDRGRPLQDALDAAGHTLATSLAGLITVLIAALPWAIIAGLVVWAARAWRRRRRA